MRTKILSVVAAAALFAAAVPALAHHSFAAEFDAKKPVTLKGTVRSDAGRARAIAIAKSTDGVTQVVDRLTIK